MAVGIIIGGAFSPIVNDVLMPPIGMLMGGVDFANMLVVIKEGTTAGLFASVAAAQEAGAVTIIPCAAVPAARSLACGSALMARP